MKRICYISRSMTGIGHKQFQLLTKSSIANNKKDGITGLLLYDRLRFLQAIEGDDQKVDDCFRRIKADERHRDISVFENGRVDNRDFGEWSLLTRGAFDINASDFKRLIEEDIQAVASTKLKAMFIGFATMVRC